MVNQEVKYLGQRSFCSKVVVRTHAYTHIGPTALLAPLVVSTKDNQAQSEYKHSLTFRVRRYVVIATKPVHRLQIHPNSEHLEGIHYHFPKLHPDPCSSVGMRRGTDTHTDTQTAVTTIHFASSTTHTKCNNNVIFSYLEAANLAFLEAETA